MPKQKRKIYLVANWKMHLTVAEASLLVHRLNKQLSTVPSNVEVVLCPSFLALQPLSKSSDVKRFSLGAQNLFHQDEGAFTGEVSAAMLRGLVDYAIVGHSERRNVFNETDKEISQKVAACLRHNIRPVLCVGEKHFERADGETDRVLHDQVTAGLNMLTAEDVAEIVIAYEPVWAISSGNDFENHPIPKPQDVEKAANAIRETVARLHNKQLADSIPVLYGGSVHADIALGYMRVRGIDGLLIGGDSLNYQHFSDIVKDTKKL